MSAEYKYPPEWQSRKLMVAGCFICFILAIGTLVALMLVILLPYTQWVSRALRIFCAICFGLFGCFSIIRPAMRKTIAESEEQYLYPLQTRAFAWSVRLSLTLTPVTGWLVGLAAALVLFVILNSCIY